MRITTDISKTWKTVLPDITFAFNKLSEPVIGFVSNGFYQKRGSVTMCTYMETCKDICSYILLYTFYVQILPLKKSVFVVHFSKTFQHGNEAFLKRGFQTEMVPLLVTFHLAYNYRGVNVSEKLLQIGLGIFLKNQIIKNYLLVLSI